MLGVALVHRIVYLCELERPFLGVVHRVLYLCELERALLGVVHSHFICVSWNKLCWVSFIV